MSSSNFSINHNAVASGAADDISVGMAVLKTDSGYVVATSANRTSYGRRADGVAITAAEAGESFQLMHDALCDAVHSGLATGTANDWVRVKADGTLERTATISSGDDVIGRCPGTNGDFHVLPNLFDSSNYAGGGGGGSFTAPTGTGFMTTTGGAMNAAATAYPATLAMGGTGATSLAAGLIKSDGSALSSITTSAAVRSLISDETGTGAMVFADTPTLVTPNIGAATGTSLAASSTVSAVTSVTTNGFFSITNGTPAGAGWFRVPYNTLTTVLGAKDSGGNDVAVIKQNSADAWIFGNLSTFSASFQGTTVGVYASNVLTLTGNGTGVASTIVLDNGRTEISAVPWLRDSASDHWYKFAVSNLAADRTITLPLLTANDTFVFADFSQTLTNKTLTSPTIGTGVTLSTSGMTTTSNGNTKGTCYDKAPVNVQTTDATVTTLDSFTLASNTAVTVAWMVTALKSDRTQAAGYSVLATFRNNGGTVSQVGTTEVTPKEDDSTWDCTIDNATTTIRLRITGKAATTIQWTAIMTRLDVIP
jgi:hypothetical protein